MTKRCTKCLNIKEDKEFIGRSDTGKLRGHCRSCVGSYQNLYHKERRLLNHSESLIRDKKTREVHSVRITEANKKWEARNKDKVYEKRRRWTSANKDRACMHAATRRSLKFRATPLWADKTLMFDVYAEAKYQQMHVDHIVPLNSKYVCGLHCEHNLQLLTKSDNSKKAHRIWPDM